MHILEHLFLAGEFAEREHLLSELTLEQVTLRPDGVPHSIYDELWHLVGYQQSIIAPTGAPVGDLYPTAPPEHEDQRRDLVQLFLNGARAAAALGKTPGAPPGQSFCHRFGAHSSQRSAELRAALHFEVVCLPTREAPAAR